MILVHLFHIIFDLAVIFLLPAAFFFVVGKILKDRIRR